MKKYLLTLLAICFSTTILAKSSEFLDDTIKMFKLKNQKLALEFLTNKEKSTPENLALLINSEVGHAVEISKVDGKLILSVSNKSTKEQITKIQKLTDNMFDVSIKLNNIESAVLSGSLSDSANIVEALKESFKK